MNKEQPNQQLTEGLLVAREFLKTLGKEELSIFEEVIQEKGAINFLKEIVAGMISEADPNIVLTDELFEVLDCKPHHKKFAFKIVEQIKREINDHLSPTVKVELMNSDARLPEYATSGSAGADIFLTEELLVPANQIVLASTGIKAIVPFGYELIIRPRSGLSLNTPLKIANSPGTIDSDYRDEIKILLWNTSDKDYVVKKGQKIAQCKLAPVQKIQWELVDKVEKEETNQRDGGFGSTGE